MATSDGTSFSAAMVASAAVIAKQLDPTINYSRFENYLKQSVRDVCTEGYDEYTGYGVLDIEKLIEVIEEDISGPTPEPTPTPAPWDEFDVTIVQKDLDYAIMTMFEEAPSDSRIIAAAYKDGRLISAKVQPVGTGAMGISFKLTCEEETDTVAVFIWAGDGIYPLHECVKQQFITEDEAEDTSAENIRSTNEPEGTQ